MKTSLILLILLCSVASVAASAQTSGVNDRSYSAGPDCKELSFKAAEEMADGFNSNDIDRVEKAITRISNVCGISEVTLRGKILLKITKDKPIDREIRIFYGEEYHIKSLSRIRDSQKSDFGYIYTNNEKFYGFVPFRHRVDSALSDVAADLLKTKDLTEDERLVCELFSGSVESFEKGFSKARRGHTSVGIYRRELMQERARQGFAFVVYSGAYSPIGRRNVIGTNPVFGITLASPIEHILTLEVGMKVRIHTNDQQFQYYAKGVVNDVNSASGLFLGAVVGVKHFDNHKYILQTKYGLGLEAIDTGLTEVNDPGNPDDNDYYSLETIHASAGVALMRSITRGNYLGIEIGLHACPYALDKSLMTPLDNFALSGELFFRF